ncbi:MAG: response regulator [Rhodocyclaceae bacterium]|nr:response regulator [Rhodocyclaceae bacterium]
MSVLRNSRQAISVSDEKLAARCARGRVIVIDDDVQILAALAALFELEGYACETYTSALAYLDILNFPSPSFPGPCCVLCDIKMPGLSGLELQRRLASLGDTPLLFMSGDSGAQEAVSAFRAGAIDFLIKPIDVDVLLASINRALACSSECQQAQIRRDVLAARIAMLTERERDIARRVAAGQTNPEIAAKLNIALRTVKLHRQRALEKIGAGGTVDLVRIADEVGL